MLVKTQNQLVVNALSDTIKQIIVVFPQKTPLVEIYLLGLQLVMENSRSLVTLKLL